MKSAFLCIAMFWAAAPSLAAEAGCEPFTRVIVDCRLADWSKREAVSIREYDELGDLLEDLIEGAPDAERCVVESEFVRALQCADDDCLRPWSRRCAQPILATFVDLAENGASLPVRWGSIAMAYATYMDGGAPPEHLAALARLSPKLLAAEQHATTRAITLKMLDFYDLKSPEVVDAFARQFDDPSRLIRGLALTRFYQATRCPLMQSWDRDEEPKREQIEDVRAWWAAHRESWKGSPE